jgi:hypothetical protein
MHRVFAFDNMIAVQGSDGGAERVTRYLIGTALDDVFAARVDGQIRYLHRDEIGSIRLVSDAAGTVIASDSYSLFGRPVTSVGSNDSGLGFTARPADGETGWIDLRARLYDPALGRFDGGIRSPACRPVCRCPRTPTTDRCRLPISRGRIPPPRAPQGT